MELEKQVCSLEFAKQLKKLRVKQESYFYWLPSITKPVQYFVEHVGQRPTLKGDEFSAFTVAELGAMLPIMIDTGKAGQGIASELLSIQKGTFSKVVQWQVMYYDVHFINDDTEADARARMLIYLLKNGLLSKGDCQ